MLIFNKLLPMVVLPLGLTMILLIVAIVRKKRWPAVAALALLYLCSLPAISDRLIHALENQYPRIPLDQVETADAIVSLGGFMGPSPDDGFVPNINEAGERLEAGIELWLRKKASWLVFTGARMPWASQAETEGARATRIAMSRGVPRGSIIITGVVGNTVDESLAIRDLMAERGWKRVILITSGWHMPRAARLFRKAGVSFLPFPVDFQTKPTMPLVLLDFFPDPQALRATESVIRELYGMAFYAIVRR